MQYRSGPAGAQGMMVAGGAVNKAKLALSQGRLDEAERLCRKQLERKPDDTMARLVLAQTLLQARQLDEGIEQVQRVLRDQPKNVDALLLLSAGLVQRSNMLRVPPEAEEAARRAVQLQPKAAKTHVQLAEVLAARRNMTDARAEIEEACRLEPRLAHAHLMRAVILQADKDPLGAVQAADSALRYDRTLAQAEYIKANALMEVHRYDEALTSLDTAVRQNPVLGGAQEHSMRGRIYFKQRKIKRSYGEYLTAQRMSGRLLRLAPLMAAIGMIFGAFGSRAPVVLGVVMAAIALLILFGISHIPVAGPWIVVALIVALAGFFAVSAVRQLGGRILPADGQARAYAIGAIGVALIAGVAMVLAIEYGIASALHRGKVWFGPLSLTIAGVLAVVLGGVAAYNWPRLLRRYGARA
jgi:tetratricopeptide (TPR) repeat protein